jgi:hypothetical protein
MEKIKRQKLNCEKKKEPYFQNDTSTLQNPNKRKEC